MSRHADALSILELLAGENAIVFAVSISAEKITSRQLLEFQVELGKWGFISASVVAGSTEPLHHLYFTSYNYLA